MNFLVKGRIFSRRLQQQQQNYNSVHKKVKKGFITEYKSC